MVQFLTNLAQLGKGLTTMAVTSSNSTKTAATKAAPSNSGDGNKTAATKTSSGKGLKGFFNSGLFKFLFACVIVFFAFKFYTHWVNEESYDSAKQLQTELNKAVNQYTDSEGYVDEGNVTAFQNAAYKCVQNYKGKRVKSKGKTDAGVWVEFDGGLTMVIEPPIKGLLNASLSSTTVIKYLEPHEFSDEAQSFVDMIGNTPNTFASKFSNARVDSKEGGGVTIKTVENMGVANTQQIIVWFGHGGYSSSLGSYLTLGELVDANRMVNDESYYSLFNSKELIMRPVFKGLGKTISYVAITPEFVSKHVKNLDGALVYLVCCESGRDSKLAQAFQKAGADTVIGFNKKVQITWAARFSQAFAQALCTPNANGTYPHVSTAKTTAESQVGESTVVNGNGGGKPVIFGNQTYCFQATTTAKRTTSTPSSASSSASSSTSTNKSSTESTTKSQSAAATTSSNKNQSTGSTTSTNKNSASAASANKSSTSTTNSAKSQNTGNAGNATNNQSNTNKSQNNGQTAPTPSTTIKESDLIGYWSPDINATEPIIVQFYKENGQLRYHYYRVLRGDGSGFNIAFEKTTFEFNSGRVELFANQGRCMCVIDGTNTSKLGFYLEDIGKGTITKDSDGEIFHRVQQ